jgi:hypothetical protein
MSWTNNPKHDLANLASHIDYFGTAMFMPDDVFIRFRVVPAIRHSVFATSSVNRFRLPDAMDPNDLIFPGPDAITEVDLERLCMTIKPNPKRNPSTRDYLSAFDATIYHGRCPRDDLAQHLMTGTTVIELGRKADEPIVGDKDRHTEGILNSSDDPSYPPRSHAALDRVLVVSHAFCTPAYWKDAGFSVYEGKTARNINLIRAPTAALTDPLHRLAAAQRRASLLEATGDVWFELAEPDR